VAVVNLFGLVLAGRRSLPRVLPLFRDAAVPQGLKIATVALAVLIVSPLNILSDIPFLGLFDDLALLSLLASAFVVVATRLRDRRLVPAPAAMRSPTALNR